MTAGELKEKLKKVPDDAIVSVAQTVLAYTGGDTIEDWAQDNLEALEVTKDGDLILRAKDWR